MKKVDESESEQEEQELPLYHVTTGEQTRPLKITVKINDQSIPMEADTGAGLSLVSEAFLQGAMARKDTGTEQ